MLIYEDNRKREARLRAEGKKEVLAEIAIRMFFDNFEPPAISRYTGLDYDEIENITRDEMIRRNHARYRDSGRAEGKMEVAAKMLEKGFDPEEVSWITDLDLEEIEKIPIENKEK